MRQVVIRISVTVSSNYPNFFAPELFTQSLKHVNLIIDAIYSFVALSVLFNHQISSLGTDNPFNWCLFRQRYVMLSRLSVSLDKGYSVHNWTVNLIVGMKFEKVKNFRNHTPVMAAV